MFKKTLYMFHFLQRVFEWTLILVSLLQTRYVIP